MLAVLAVLAALGSARAGNARQDAGAGCRAAAP